MGGHRELTIFFKDGSSTTLKVAPLEADKAIRAFQNAGAGAKPIRIGLLNSFDDAVISPSEIRAMVPRWVEDRTPTYSQATNSPSNTRNLHPMGHRARRGTKVK